jgi:hypothetical protein
MYTMNKDDAASTKRFVDEAAGMRHPDEKILVWLVFNGYTQVSYARLWMMSGDRFGANRDDMCNTPFCQRAGRLCRDKTTVVDANESTCKVRSSRSISLEGEEPTFPKRVFHQ